jgi:NADPH:quinone reductase-like Zn-dependent oxidoreductase
MKAIIATADTMMRVPTPAIGRLFLGLTKPSALTHAQAAPLCDGYVTSLNFLKNLGNIQPGQTILINGAAGSLGTAAIQLAKHFGASVTGVCSTANVDFVKSLGADTVIDYTQEDFTQYTNAYDIIYDTIYGTIGKSSYTQCKNTLTQHGRYLSPVLGLPLLLQMLRTSFIGTKKAKFSATGALPTPEVLTLLNEVIQIIQDRNLTPIIDKHYPLDQAADAHRHIETGHKKANIILDIMN